VVRSMSSGETGVGKSDKDWERWPPRIGGAGGSCGIVVVGLEGMVVVQRHFGKDEGKDRRGISSRLISPSTR
jgi:hypothetical protein